MASRFWLSRPAAGFDQAFILLLVGAVAVGVTLVAVLPLPAGGIWRVVAVAAVVGADALVFGLLWRRQWRAHLAQIDERLERADAELTAAEHLASVGRVAAGIAHEIGNPLTGIANYSHVLRSRTAGNAEAVRALDGIDHEVARVDRIVRSLLDYARPQPQSPVPFDGRQALREALDLLAAQGVFRQVQVEAMFDEVPLGLVGNEHEVEQAFVNLLLNAIAAVEARGRLALYAGRVSPESLGRAPQRRSGDAAAAARERRTNHRLAEWRARRKPNQPCAKFVIADSGPGIVADEADRIFEPFYTTKPRPDGSGLGLAIVQRVVESHDGVVWAQPAREGGAAFHIVLPLRNDSDGAPLVS